MIILPEDQNIVSLLSAEDSKALLMALFSEPDNVTELSPLVNMAYTVIKGKSDRISEKKSRAGKQGGAPQGNQNAQKQAEQATTQETSETSHRTSTVPLPSSVINDNNDAREDDSDLPPEMRDGDVARVNDAFTKNIKFPMEADTKALIDWLGVFNPDTMCYAINQAALSGAKTFRTLEVILRRWQEIGVKDLAGAEGAQLEWGKRNQTRASPQAPPPPERKKVWSAHHNGFIWQDTGEPVGG